MNKSNESVYIPEKTLFCNSFMVKFLQTAMISESKIY